MIAVFGGTSDAIAICDLLDDHGCNYLLSVATEEGALMASHLKGKISIARLDTAQMISFFKENGVHRVIDATHPHAAIVSKNIIEACESETIQLVRYERKTQIDLVEDPLLIKVASVTEACEALRSLGKTIFLTTGSKELATYMEALPDKKWIVRVLPTVSVLESCNQLGLGINEIVAMKGPFSESMNRAMIEHYQPDAVVTKESGDEGGYQEKIRPCLHLGVPCVVIRRPQLDHKHLVSTLDELTEFLVI